MRSIAPHVTVTPRRNVFSRRKPCAGPKWDTISEVRKRTIVTNASHWLITWRFSTRSIHNTSLCVSRNAHSSCFGIYQSRYSYWNFKLLWLHFKLASFTVNVRSCANRLVRLLGRVAFVYYIRLLWTRALYEVEKQAVSTRTSGYCVADCDANLFRHPTSNWMAAICQYD